MHTSMCKCLQMYANMGLCMQNVCKYGQMYTSMCKCAQMYAHMGLCMQVFVQMCETVCANVCKYGLMYAIVCTNVFNRVQIYASLFTNVCNSVQMYANMGKCIQVCANTNLNCCRFENLSTSLDTTY